MKRNWEFTIKMPNPLARWQHRRRTIRSVEKWNGDLDYIMSEAKKTEDGAFKWGHLVWQEISMYIRLGEQVDPDEFRELCRRRGFTPEMRTYLQDTLVHLGLGKRLKGVCWAEKGQEKTPEVKP